MGELKPGLVGKTFKDNPERARLAGMKNKGKKKSPATVAKMHLAQSRNTTNPLWANKNLTPEQAHFVSLLAENKFATAVKDMLLFIATKAETAEDYHKLLTQLMKIPFLQKALDDINKEKQKDIVPIIIDLLKKHNHEELIGELARELERNGWDTSASNS